MEYDEFVVEPSDDEDAETSATEAGDDCGYAIRQLKRTLLARLENTCKYLVFELLHLISCHAHDSSGDVLGSTTLDRCDTVSSLSVVKHETHGNLAYKQRKNEQIQASALN